MSVKDLHLLYEQWCFLALVRAVAEVVGCPLPVRDLVAVEQHGLRVRLRRGGEQTVRFGAPSGVRVALTYNPRFVGEPLLVPQQPDTLLEISGPDRSSVRLVLDAKYRLDTSPEYLRRYGSPGPPEDALNTLHRYRDAILRSGGGTAAPAERTVAGAIALFPYREAEEGAFRTSRLWRSIERIGVGAIPLLPNGTGYLEEWVRRVVEREP